MPKKGTTIKIIFLKKLERIAMWHHNPLIKKILINFLLFGFGISFLADRVVSFYFIEHIWCRIFFYEFDVIPNWRNIDHHNTEFVSWRKVIVHFLVLKYFSASRIYVSENDIKHQSKHSKHNSTLVLIKASGSNGFTCGKL